MATSNKYRLEVMLKTRERDKRRAEEALAKAIAALTKARKKEEELVEEKKAIHQMWVLRRQEMRDKMDVGGRVGEGNVYVRYLRKLKEQEEAKQEEIERQREVVRQCDEKVTACRRAYIDAAKALQIMEKHKDLWRRKLAAELSRKEEREFDELGNVIHGRRQAQGA
jgi:flagellar export protein FliJ